MKRVDFDPERRAQSAEPRQLGLRAHQLGRGARHRRERDQAPEARPRPRRDRRAPTARITPGATSATTSAALFRFAQRRRHDRGAPQPRQLGRLVLGRDASLGLHAARRPVGDLRHGRGLPQELEMVVFWSGDPESTSGSYGAQEGTVRRQWLKEARHQARPHRPVLQRLGAVLRRQVDRARSRPPRPALAMAIAYVWITEGIYDKEYVDDAHHRLRRMEGLRARRGGRRRRRRPSGRRRRPACRPGTCARSRANGRARGPISRAGGWGNGHGGACRNPTGIQWARTMVCLIAMQGLGKPGVNMGNLQWGTPLDFNFYFPGYAEGGMSGDWRTPRCASSSTSACRSCRR